MKKLGKGIVTLVCVVGLVAILTGGCFQDLMTPCHINPDVIEYSEQEATSYLPWTTVFDAERIKSYTDYKHVDFQAFYDNAKALDRREYIFLTDGLNGSIASARQLQQRLFSPTGSVGMIMTTLFGGTIGAMFIKRPGDKSKREVELENGNKKKGV